MNSHGPHVDATDLELEIRNLGSAKLLTEKDSLLH